MPQLRLLYTGHSVYPDVTELLHNSTLNVVQKTLLKCFFHVCATNSDNNRCYDVLETLITDSRRVDATCPSDRSSCPSTCRNSLLTFRDNSECCVNLYNNSATFPFPFSFTADDYSLWASCSVETPGFCTESSVSRSSSSATGTCNPLLAGLLLLGVVMVLVL